MKKYLLPLIIVLLLGLYFGISRLNKPIVNPTSPNNIQIQTLQLPTGWSQVSDTGDKLKIKKQVDKGLIPQVVLIKSTSQEASSSAVYVDKLISGARSAIPSLRITSDRREVTNDQYISYITGFYFNQKQKVKLVQRIYIIEKTAYTATASFEGNLETEINDVIDQIVKNRI